MSPLGGGVFAERNARAQAASDEAAAAAAVDGGAQVGTLPRRLTDIDLRLSVLATLSSQSLDAVKAAYDWVTGKD